MKPGSHVSRRASCSRRRGRRRAAARRMRPASRVAGVIRRVLDSAEALTQAVQRACSRRARRSRANIRGARHLAPISSPTARPMPDDPGLSLAAPAELRRLAARGRRPRRAADELSLADLRALPSRTQITRHDCVEGWSCIGQWKGAQLRRCSNARGPEARGALHRLLLRRHARADARRHRPLLRDRSTLSTPFTRRPSSPTR